MPEHEPQIQSHVLEREYSRFRALFQHAPVGFVLTDDRATITELNQLAADVLGQPDEKLRGRPIFSFLPEEAHPELRGAFASVLESGVTQARQLTVRREDDRTLPLEFHLRTVADDDSEVCWLLLDLTERPPAGQPDPDRAPSGDVKIGLDQIMGVVSHELRTPLTMLLGNISVLARQRQVLSEAEVEDTIRALEDESQQLREIIENMLAFKRAGESTSLEPILLRHALAKYLKHANGVLRGRAVSLSVEEGMRPVLANEASLEQVIGNYLSNAAKYSPDETLIEVRAASEGDAAAIEVLDRGRGFGPREQDHLFEPFFRAPGVEGRTRGAGLGLAACRLLAELQGGHTWAKPRPGGGSIFALNLPLVADTPSD